MKFILEIGFEQVECVSYKYYIWFRKWVYISKVPYCCDKKMKWGLP